MHFRSADLNIEAWVETLVENKRLNEYRPTYGVDPHIGRAGTLCSSYLECEEGKTFRVRLSAPAAMMAQQPGLVAFLYVDGQHATGSFWARTDPSVHLSKMYMNEGGKQYSADLTFTTLQKTDEESQVQVQGPELSKLCKMEVVIRRGVQGNSRPFVAPVIKETGKVHEKQLKLGSTVVAANKVPYPPSNSADFIADWQRPEVCRFSWTYHTRDKLLVMGIINEAPAAAPPAPLPNPRRRTRASLAGEDEDEDDIQVTKAPRLTVKKEKGASGVKEEPISVSEHGRTTRSGLASGSGRKTIIDLTGEDE